jgi:hypothetical protein
MEGAVRPRLAATQIEQNKSKRTRNNLIFQRQYPLVNASMLTEDLLKKPNLLRTKLGRLDCLPYALDRPTTWEKQELRANPQLPIDRSPDPPNRLQ